MKSEIDELYKRLPATRDELIETAHPLCRMVPHEFVNRWPIYGHYLDELESACLLALVKAVDALAPPRPDGKAFAYLWRALWRRCDKTVDQLDNHSHDCLTEDVAESDEYAAALERVLESCVSDDERDVILRRTRGETIETVALETAQSKEQVRLTLERVYERYAHLP